MAFMNPQVFQMSNFKMICDLFILIFKVSSEHRHMMTRIAYVHPDEGEKAIVSVWCGAGMESDPTKRISELLTENARLKEQLHKHINNQNPLTSE